MGENGVGTLQACNILSKMTLIITTNGSNLSIGVIPDKGSNGPHMPSCLGETS